jgi:hypothetical protein
MTAEQEVEWKKLVRTRFMAFQSLIPFVESMVHVLQVSGNADISEPIEEILRRLAENRKQMVAFVAEHGPVKEEVEQSVM